MNEPNDAPEPGDQITKADGNYNLHFGTIQSVSKSGRSLTVLWENGKQQTVSHTKFNRMTLLKRHRTIPGDP